MEDGAAQVEDPFKCKIVSWYLLIIVLILAGFLTVFFLVFNYNMTYNLTRCTTYVKKYSNLDKDSPNNNYFCIISFLGVYT